MKKMLIWFLVVPIIINNWYDFFIVCSTHIGVKKCNKVAEDKRFLVQEPKSSRVNTKHITLHTKVNSSLFKWVSSTYTSWGDGDIKEKEIKKGREKVKK